MARTTRSLRCTGPAAASARPFAAAAASGALYAAPPAPLPGLPPVPPDATLTTLCLPPPFGAAIAAIAIALSAAVHSPGATSSSLSVSPEWPQME